MEATIKNLSDVFNGSRILEIPFFQRAYVWGEKQQERLLDDLVNVCSNKKHYFIGALILKQKRTITDKDCGDIRTVIDGQQRLTALTILCKVLCLKNGEMKKFDRRFRLGDDSISLRHNDKDRETYERIMNLTQIENIDNKNKVAETYNYFRKNLDHEKLNFEYICTLLNFVSIDLTKEEEDEQQIFDTINSLGVHLTAAELLKNYFFCHGEEDRANYEKYWKAIFEKDDATRSYWDREIKPQEENIDIFFFSYLQIKAREVGISSDEASMFMKKELLFNSYKDLIKNHINGDHSIVLNEIPGYSQLFKNAIDSVKLGDTLPLQGIERINAIIFSLGTTAIIPYILFIEKNVTDNKEKNKIYDFIEAYVVRRVITGIGSLDYDKIFGSRLISEHISSYDKLRNYFAMQKGKERICMPSDKEVKQSFHDSIIIDVHVKTILYLMESKIRNQKYQSTQLLRIGGYTLEHIMPRGWRKEWPPAKNSYERDIKLQTLGNLAIISRSLNMSVSNQAWAKKKIEIERYSLGLETLCGATEKEKWDEDAIEERAEKLAEYAIKIWPGI